MALREVIEKGRDGKYRAIYVQVEDELHPAAVRQRVDEELQKRLRDEVSIEQLIAALYRYCRVMERAILKQSEAGDQDIVERVHDLFAQVHKLQQKAEQLKEAAATATPEELKKLDIRTDAEWFDRKPKKEDADGGKEKNSEPVKP